MDYIYIIYSVRLDNIFKKRKKKEERNRLYMQTCRVLINTTKVLRVTHLVPVLVARDQGKFEERDFDQYHSIFE